MSSSAALLEKVPEHWASMVRPFLQRSREFENKEPLVSYFLRTHVAFLCMKNRKKEDKAGTSFLMALLEALEGDKAKLGSQLDGVDGRTTLTRFALMLFARADDAERTGNASMNIVRIFYTAAVLFEATEQFTEDGAMDNIAAQKCKYAKYIAARMKKALDANEPYVSPNKLEPVEGGPEATDIGSNSNFTTAPASCFARPESNPASQVKGGEKGPAAVPQAPPGPPPALPKTSNNNYNAYNNASVHSPNPPSNPPPSSQAFNTLAPMRQDPPPPAYTYDSGASSNNTTPAPASASSNKSSGVAGQRFNQSNNNNNNNNKNNNNTPSLPAVVAPAAQRQSSGNSTSNLSASPYAANTAATTSSGNFKPSVDQMIDAQKFASRAVSALQFYDYENAKKQLIAAMQILNGVQH